MPVGTFWQSRLDGGSIPPPPPDRSIKTKILIYKKNFRSKRVLINHQIKASMLRLVDEEGKQIGVMKLQEALRLGREKNLDIVLITEKTDPPICKVIDYGKYLYQQKKHEKKVKGSQVKGVRLKFNISLHDMETKAKQAKKFLDEGDRIRIELVLRGRQKALTDFAREKMNKFTEVLSSYLPIEIDQPLKKTPRGLILIIKKGKHESQNQEITDKKIQAHKKGEDS